MAIELTELIPTLESHLHEWLPNQPWFDAHHDDLSHVEAVDLQIIGRDWPLTCLVDIDVVLLNEPARVHLVVGLAPVVPECVGDGEII